jgi:hypothetical protein
MKVVSNKPICCECKQVITQKKYALFHGKPCHIDYDQCFYALRKRIKDLTNGR